MKQLVLILSIIVSGLAIGQSKSVPFDKALFKDKKDAFKVASKALEEGNLLFTQGRIFYKLALEHFLKANEFNPKNADLNYKIGLCYLNSVYKSKALEYFRIAYALEPTVSTDIHFKLGRSQHLRYAFDKAIYEYELFRKTLDNNKDLDKIMEVNRLIEECRTGKDLMDHPERVWVDNLGQNINSPRAEYGPLISADEEVIIFTTRRKESTGGERSVDERYYEDIWISHRDENGKWEPAASISDKINTDGHDATAGLSNDGLSLFLFYDGGKKDMGDIYLSNKGAEGWEKPKNLGKHINGKESWDTGASFSFDKKTIYFVSNREGTKGMRDIWKSTWNEEKEGWNDPTNLGDVINTPYDEVGVFMHPDGQTMYFSSQGHKGMGGFDIYSSRLDEQGNWSTPKNIGYPVSTPDDDVFFVVSASGTHAYYSSFREEDGMGEKDLYMITFLGPEKQPMLSSEDNLMASIAAPVKEELVQPKVEVRMAKVSILKGIVLDAETKEPVGASIDLVDNSEAKAVSEFQNDPEKGNFLISLPAGKNYGIAVKAEGYLFHSENFDIPEDAGFKEYEKVVYLKKIKKGESIVLRNIFFANDRYDLLPESTSELERLLTLLEENPEIRIEISGHTDTKVRTHTIRSCLKTEHLLSLIT